MSWPALNEVFVQNATLKALNFPINDPQDAVGLKWLLLFAENAATPTPFQCMIQIVLLKRLIAMDVGVI